MQVSQNWRVFRLAQSLRKERQAEYGAAKLWPEISVQIKPKQFKARKYEDKTHDSDGRAGHRDDSERRLGAGSE